MEAGILIVGSLLWDHQEKRKAWRESRLALERAVPVRASIRYGRKSSSRGNTFTMVLDAEEDLGQAVVVPCRDDPQDIQGLWREAGELWGAEQLEAPDRTISGSWGCVGACFRGDARLVEGRGSWSARFTAEHAVPVSPVDESGLLQIPWPTVVDESPLDLDLILATATKAEAARPSPEQIADAWIQQDDEHESYFFENVRCGIRTPDDLEIWHRIEARSPDWLADDSHPEAIAVLLAESRSATSSR